MGYSAMIFSVSVLFICFLALFLSKAFTYIDAEILKGLECMKKSCYGVYYYYTMLFSDNKAEVDQLCLNTTLLFLVRNAAICFTQ